MADITQVEISEVKPVSFLFMDERYADNNLPTHLRATTLTGIVIPAERHSEIRSAFYELVTDALGDPPGTISAMPTVHASELFVEKEDKVKFVFLQGLVDLVKRFHLKVFHMGYTDRSVAAMGMGNDPTMGLLFAGMINCISDELKVRFVWPVMEIDRKDRQDQAFAGYIQYIGYLSARLGKEQLSVDNENLGECLYSTKKSALGSIVDCVAYLIHSKTLRKGGVQLTDFKARLAEIAEGLEGYLAFDEIIEITRDAPPPGYSQSGPFRYALPIVPQD